MLVLLSQYYTFTLTLKNTPYIYLHMHISERKRKISFMIITYIGFRKKKQVQQLLFLFYQMIIHIIKTFL